MIAEVVEVLKLSLSINKLGISERTVQEWCVRNNIQTQIIAFGRKSQYILYEGDIKGFLFIISNDYSELI